MSTSVYASRHFKAFPEAKMADYTTTTIKLPQEVALSLDKQLTRQHKVKI